MLNIADALFKFVEGDFLVSSFGTKKMNLFCLNNLQHNVAKHIRTIECVLLKRCHDIHRNEFYWVQMRLTKIEFRQEKSCCVVVKYCMIKGSRKKGVLTLLIFLSVYSYEKSIIGPQYKRYKL